MMDKGFKKALCALFALSLTFSSFAEVPDWLLGTWTYGDLNVTFTTDTIIVKEGNITVSKGTYTLDVGGYVVPEWEGYDHEEGDEDMLIADSYNKKVCIEGGPWLEKFATNTGTIDNEDFGLNNVVDSYIKSSKPYIGNIMWAYGVWKLKDTRACIYITPLYIKSIGINDDYLDGKDVKDVDKKWEVARAEENELIGNVVRIGDYYLDIPSKMIYSLRGIDEKTYLEKVEDYQNWKIALAVIILLGIVVTVAILVLRLIIKLIRWLIRIIRTFRERVQKTALSAGAAIKKKKIEVTESVKNYKDHTGAQISAFKSNNHLTKFAKLAAVVVAAFLMIHWCGGSGQSEWVGTWLTPGGDHQWVFDLRSDGTAHVSLAGLFEYETEWVKEKEDDYAVIKGMREGDVQAYLLYKNGTLRYWSRSKNRIEDMSKDFGIILQKQ